MARCNGGFKGNWRRTGERREMRSRLHRDGRGRDKQWRRLDARRGKEQSGEVSEDENRNPLVHIGKVTARPVPVEDSAKRESEVMEKPGNEGQMN